MVNVAGRSKGCSTCRQRRIKCDERRPVCLRCQKSDLDCDGPKDITIVQDRIVKSRRTQREPRALPVPLWPKLDEVETSICYTRRYFTIGGPIYQAQQKLRLSDVVASNSNATASLLFTTAFMSFATIVFGTQQHQSSIVDNGYVMHGKALEKLNETLSDRRRCESDDDVLLSVATLATLEALVPTHPKSYLNHMLGLQKLLELRDPAKHSSPGSCEFYKAARHMVIFASLRTGKAAVFAQSRWKAILRAHCSDDEMWEQDLFDILADCTLLIAELEASSSNGAATQSQGRGAKDDLGGIAMALLEQLRVWLERWTQDNGDSYTTERACFISSQHQREPDDKASPSPSLTPLSFTDSSAAALYMLYNTALIMVYRLLSATSVKGGSFNGRHFPRPGALPKTARLEEKQDRSDDEFAVAEHATAMEICRLIPYCINSKTLANSSAPPIVHWAILTAWTTLGCNATTEGRWLVSMLDKKQRGFIARGLWGG